APSRIQGVRFCLNRRLPAWCTKNPPTFETLTPGRPGRGGGGRALPAARPRQGLPRRRLGPGPCLRGPPLPRPDRMTATPLPGRRQAVTLLPVWEISAWRPFMDIAPDSEETRALLDRARAGDRQAFEQLFARYRPFLERLVALRLDPRLRARIDPSDVVQETQLEAVRRLEAYLQDPAMPFRLWLRQLASDRLAKARRHHFRQARAVGRELHLPEQSSLDLARQLLD